MPTSLENHQPDISIEKPDIDNDLLPEQQPKSDLEEKLSEESVQVVRELRSSNNTLPTETFGELHTSNIASAVSSAQLTPNGNHLDEQQTQTLPRCDGFRVATDKKSHINKECARRKNSLSASHSSEISK